MKHLYLLLLACTVYGIAFTQNRKIAVIGSSTAAGLATSSPDSSWVRRVNHYYKYQLGALDTIYNLGVSGTNVYAGMPSSYTPPASRPSPRPAENITQAVKLLSDLSTPSNGVVIVNYPSGGYDTYSIAEIMNSLQRIYDSAVRNGNRCYITTTQPRTDGNFASSAVKRKLADLKDSIINRFGVDKTINFWDGMFNPADTTLLAKYSAGDNVHFNNAGHRELFRRVVEKNIFSLATTPGSGDYRSNTTSAGGAWSTPANWQVYNGTDWVTATAAPNSSSGVITIRTGQRLDLTVATTIDQVTIETGASLYIYHSNTPTVFTLNDGPGADIEVNGSLFVSANATLTGAGTIQNNYGGVFEVRNQGILSANAVNRGRMNIRGTGNFQNATVTNNRIFTLVEFTLNLNNAALINNDSISLASSGDTYFAGTGGTVINNRNAIIHKAAATGITRFNPGVSLTNNGIIKGLGEYQLINTTVNTGVIAPGGSPGSLRVNPNLINGKAPVLDIEISATGGQAGTHYDQLVISSVDVAAVNLGGATLRVTDRATDPVGTVYTIITKPTGTMNGRFASVELSPSLSGPVYNTNSITVQKISVLPLAWGGFTAMTANGSVQLTWTTLQEYYTSHFVVEHAVGNERFDSVGIITAAGEGFSTRSYTFTHHAPALASANKYRIRQVDQDGWYSYSEIISARFDGPVLAVAFAPNPVRDVLTIQVYKPRTTIMVVGINGNIIRALELPVGQHTLNVAGLTAGVYFIRVYNNSRYVTTEKIVKLN